MTQPRPTFQLDFEALRLALIHERRVFFLFLGAVLVAAGVVTALTPKQYEAIALIQLLPRAGQEMEVDAVVKLDDGGYLERRDRARTQLQVILSRSVRAEVVQRYNTLGHDDIPATEEGYERLRSRMSATPREDTELVEIGVTSTDPEEAAILANLVTEVYRASNLDMRTDAARETQGWIEGQSGAYRAALDAASAKVMAFKEANNAADIDEQVDGISTRLAALQTAAGDATTRRVLLESKLSEHRRLVAVGAYDVLAGQFDDPALQAIARERAAIVTETAEVLARYGDQHPENKNAQERMKRIEALIAKEVDRNVRSERSLVETLRRQETEIAAEVAGVKLELLEKQRLQSDYSVLKQDEDRARALFSSLGARGAEVDLQASTRLTDMRILDPAVPPTRPIKPNVMLNMMAALAVGVAGGLGLALLRHRVQDTLLSTGDIGRLDVPLLGIIPSLGPDVKPEDRDLYTVGHPRSLVAEAFRGIRSVVQSFPSATPSRRYVITSCLEQEGKSLAAIGIAVSFASLGQRVLLVDGDLRLPRLHRAFGVPEAPGLADCFVDESDLTRFCLRTQVPRLHLLRSGTRTDYPNELLASAVFERALVRLGESYDVVLIDTAPASLVADAMALGRMADGVILVARRGKVARNLVIRTLASLRQTGATVVGVALNDVPRDSVGYGSRYYDERARTADT